MMTIHKFSLQGVSTQKVEMPEGAVVLSVQNQNDVACLWARVDTGAPLVERTFRIFGTGQLVDSSLLFYIGTVQIGSEVWHVFEQGAA